MKTVVILFCFAVFIHGVRAEKKRLLILQTTDIHGRFRSGTAGSPSGWLRIASAIKEKRAVAGGKNKVLLIDCGDTFQGTAAGSFFKGKLAAGLMNELGYDIWVIGNHEFDFGMKNTEKLIGLIHADSFAGNLEPSSGKRPFKCWKIYKKNGLSIAFIGLTLSYLDSSVWGSIFENFRIESIESVLDRIMPKIADNKPDIVILGIHQGLTGSRSKASNLWNIAGKYPQINLILGGHNHQNAPGNVIGWRTWYACAGKHGENFLEANAEFDTETRETVFTSKLVPASDYPEDPESAKLVKKSLDYVAGQEARKVGRFLSPVRKTPEGALNSSLNELFGRAVTSAVKVKVAFLGAPALKSSFAGEITVKTLYLMMPYENKIGILELNHEQVSEVITEQVKGAGKNIIQSPWGIYANIDKNGKMKDELRFADGSTWKNKEQKIKIAFDSYSLAGAGNRFPKLRKLARSAANKPLDSGILVRKALLDYISARSPLRIKKIKWLKVADE